MSHDGEMTMIGRGREALGMIVDPDSFEENAVGGTSFDEDYGPGAVVGNALIGGHGATVIASDANAFNDRFPVVFAGVIGLEEAYKMALTVYATVETDAGRPASEKRPIILIVDTPGNAPGKLEEILGMNKATGAYQLALAEARRAGHPVIAMVIGRAISGGFLCHGLQTDYILALSKKYGTIIHVMPISSIARITKMDIERLEEIATDNPVFAAGVDDFYRLGGVDEIVENIEDMREAILRSIEDIRVRKASGDCGALGPEGRGMRGAERGGRRCRANVLNAVKDQFSLVADRYLNA